MSYRVVITGMGVVSPVGNNVPSYWEGLLAGRSGVGLITRFDTGAYPAKIAAEVKDFDSSDLIEKKEARRMDLSNQYAIVACEEALKDAGIDPQTADPERIGVVIGSGIGGIGTFERQHHILEESGPDRVSPFFIPMMIINLSAGLVSIRYGFRGPSYATVSACATSSHAIADAFRIVQRGEADIMVTGGSEATITPSSLAGFCQCKALSTRNDQPEKASRPFDTDRDGFVMGEGAAILILESLESAQKRGVKIYGEVLGVGMTSDAYHITAPHPEGLGIKKVMQIAIDEAGLKPEQIDYVNTHGTSTGLGDVAETKAVKEVLGEHAYKIPVNSTKSMIGHLLGSAGAIELIACLKSIETGEVHPTINLDNPDPLCDLDYVPHTKRTHAVRYALSNSFGFGGHNVSLIVGSMNGHHA